MFIKKERIKLGPLVQCNFATNKLDCVNKFFGYLSLRVPEKFYKTLSCHSNRKWVRCVRDGGGSE